MTQMCPQCSQDNRDTGKFCARCGMQLQGLLGAHTLLQMRYDVIRVLGYGGMGAVYLALDHRLGENEVAVKENFDTSPDAQAQFQREANVLAKLDHPNLPKVIDHFIEPDGRQYLVMEYVGGEDLAALVAQRGPLPEADVLAWADRLLDALAYLHNRPQPIIHRDIKPSNIKLTSEGKVKLVDFGLVKFFNPINPRTSTIIHGLGSPGYAPPEQYNAKAHTDQRSDIYALGASLYCLLTGVEPPEANLRAADPNILQAPRQINPLISRESESAILKAMQLAQIDRYKTVGEFKMALISPRTLASVPKRQPSHRAIAIFGLMAALAMLPLVLFVSSINEHTQAALIAPTDTVTKSLIPSQMRSATSSPVPTATETPTAEPSATATSTSTPTPSPTSIPPTPIPPTVTLMPTARPTRLPTVKPTQISTRTQAELTVLEVAAGKPTSASSFYHYGTEYSFQASAVVDRRTNELWCTNGIETGNSYWLLVDHQTGWVQIDLQHDYPVVKIRWLNTHNGGCNDRATTRFHIALSQTGSFSGEEIMVQGGSMSYSSMPQYEEVVLPASVLARYVRYYVDEYYNWGGGLNELEVYAQVPVR